MQTVMIVEDDPDIRDGVRILLSGEGYRILDNITSNLLNTPTRRRASTKPCGASRISTSPTAPSWCISAICGWQSRRTAISKLFCQSDTIAVSKLFLQHPCPLRHLR